jgi:uncharacterized membrane protein (DUF373 family)
MRSFKEIKSNYSFSEEDAARLRSLKDLMTECADQIMESLHSWMLGTKETANYFNDEVRKKRVFESHRAWLLELFSGTYDNRYYERLIRIGQTHVKAMVEPHYMNRAINLFRNVFMDIINRQIEDPEQRTKVLISIDKILDINLDIITSSYIEEELRTFSPAYRVRNALITFSERFAQTMNLVLIIALMGLTIGVVGLFVYDLQKLLTVDLNSGIITALGSLLVLWIMIELMNTEIKHLKGGKFRISVFIGVALVAFIRDTMIMALKHEDTPHMTYLIALILILGIVFWLVTRAEERSS